MNYELFRCYKKQLIVSIGRIEHLHVLNQIKHFLVARKLSGRPIKFCIIYSLNNKRKRI